MRPAHPEEDDRPLAEWFACRDAWLALAARLLTAQAILQSVFAAVAVGMGRAEQGLWGPLVAASGVSLWALLTAAVSQVALRQGYPHLTAQPDAAARAGWLVRTQLLVAAVVGTLLSMPIVFGWVEVPWAEGLAVGFVLVCSHALYGWSLSRGLEADAAVLLPLRGSPPSPGRWIGRTNTQPEEG